MRAHWAGLIVAAFLLGCGQATPPSSAPAQGTQAQSFAGAERADVANAPADSRSASTETPGAPPTGAQTSYLAYSYQVDMELPATRIGEVMDAHIRACQQAGPSVCQLTGSTRSGDPASQVSGAVSLRAEPQWLQRFMSGISGQVGAAGGRITQQSTNTEDLSRSIVDTEARLRASRALRDRLQNLLQSRPGKLSDLLDVERELARVQGDIDAMESTLAVMQARVDMSELTLNYASAAQSLRADTFEPLKLAASGFLGVMVQIFAILIYLVAVLLPLALVGGLIAWLVLTLRRRARDRAARAETPPPAANA